VIFLASSPRLDDQGLDEQHWGLSVYFNFRGSLCRHNCASGAYASWFARHSLDSSLDSSNENLLLTVLSYVVSALPDPSLCLSAATALRNLCEANRTALAVHIGAFGELHASLDSIPVSLRFPPFPLFILLSVGFREKQNSSIYRKCYPSYAS